MCVCVRARREGDAAHALGLRDARAPGMTFRVFRIEGFRSSGFRVQGFRVYGLGFRV